MIQQRDTMEKQQKAMEKQLDEMHIQQRPWVYADLSVLSVKFNRKIPKFTLQFKLYNAGKTPAMHVVIASEIYSNVAGPDTAIGKQAVSCNKIQEDTNVSGGTIFPNQTLTGEATMQMLPEEFESDIHKPALPVIPFGKLEAVRPIVVGCIDYQTPNGKSEHRQTGFAYRLISADSSWALESAACFRL